MLPGVGMSPWRDCQGERTAVASLVSMLCENLPNITANTEDHLMRGENIWDLGVQD